MSNLLKASLWISLSELVFNISGYIVHALLGRILDPAGYGRFSIIITFTTMLVVLVGRGVPIATSKFLGGVTKDKVNGYYDIKKTALYLQLVIIVLITAIYYSLSSFFANVLNDPTLTSLFKISSLITPAFALASFYAYYFTGIQEFKIKSFLKFLRSIFKVIFVVGLGYAYKVKGAIVGQALAPFLVFLSAYLLDPHTKAKLKKKKGFKNNPVDYSLMKKLAKFAGPVVVFMLFHELTMSMNLYFIKAMLGSDELTGIYSAASTVSRIPYYLFFFLTIILLPKISELISRGEKEKTRKLLSKAFKYLFITLIPITFLLSLFSDSAIRFFYGSQYASAGSIMSILIFGSAFLTVYYILVFALNGAGKNKFPVITSFVGATLNGLLNWYLITKMGLIGSAVATTITAFIIMIWVLIYANKNIAKFINLASILKYTIASITIYISGQMLFSQGRLTFILWSIILLIIYLLIMIASKELTKKDWGYLATSLKK